MITKMACRSSYWVIVKEVALLGYLVAKEPFCLDRDIYTREELNEFVELAKNEVSRLFDLFYRYHLIVWPSSYEYQLRSDGSGEISSVQVETPCLDKYGYVSYRPYEFYFDDDKFIFRDKNSDLYNNGFLDCFYDGCFCKFEDFTDSTWHKDKIVSALKAAKEKHCAKWDQGYVSLDRQGNLVEVVDDYGVIAFGDNDIKTAFRGYRENRIWEYKSRLPKSLTI